MKNGNWGREVEVDLGLVLVSFIKVNRVRSKDRKSNKNQKWGSVT